MRYRGYSQARTETGELTDSIVGLLDLYAPSWLGYHFIDIEDSRNAREELAEKIAEVPPDANVVLSYRAQIVLIEIMYEEQDVLDQLFALSVDMPQAEGDRFRKAIADMQRDLDGRIAALVRANVKAAGQGIPPAEEFIEAETGVSRTLTGLEIGGLVIAGVLVMAVIITVGTVVYKSINSLLERLETLATVEKFIDIGRPELAADIFGEARKKEFPWGWLIGVTTAVGLGGLAFAYFGGYLGEAGKKLGSG